MATRNVLFDNAELSPLGMFRLVRWSGLLNGDDGATIDCLGYEVLSWQTIGTNGLGGSFSLMGCLDPADNPGNTVSTTSGGLVNLAVPIRVSRLRPVVNAGDGTTNIAIVVLLRRAL